MLPRHLKSAFYASAGPLMKINGVLYRRFRAPRDGRIQVHLGPGQKNYIDGWINVDANIFTGKCDVWADLRNPLPFHDSTVDAFYSHHMIEHLPDIRNHLVDVFRCLKPGGTYRLGGPNGDSAIAKFVQDDKAWFGDFPDKRRSIGGRLENFVFCRQEHLTILTFSFLQELLEDAGYVAITGHIASVGTSRPEIFSDCFPFESEPDHEYPRTLVIEASKPD